ncbi:hypothetical protein DIPPA_06306 [Diplonema papillatum]|nr:hypothetical protein DIPPA_06306 [Diplonema papillatum]KAJ9463582.1 hypothetical protein DIPPA_06306 [Diplonema papillatum]
MENAALETMKRMWEAFEKREFDLREGEAQLAARERRVASRERELQGRMEEFKDTAQRVEGVLQRKERALALVSDILMQQWRAVEAEKRVVQRRHKAAARAAAAKASPKLSGADSSSSSTGGSRRSVDGFDAEEPAAFDPFSTGEHSAAQDPSPAAEEERREPAFDALMAPERVPGQGPRGGASVPEPHAAADGAALLERMLSFVKATQLAPEALHLLRTFHAAAAHPPPAPQPQPIVGSTLAVSWTGAVDLLFFKGSGPLKKPAAERFLKGLFAAAGTPASASVLSLGEKDVAAGPAADDPSLGLVCFASAAEAAAAAAELNGAALDDSGAARLRITALHRPPDGCRAALHLPKGGGFGASAQPSRVVRITGLPESLNHDVFVGLIGQASAGMDPLGAKADEECGEQRVTAINDGEEEEEEAEEEEEEECPPGVKRPWAGHHWEFLWDGEPSEGGGRAAFVSFRSLATAVAVLSAVQDTPRRTWAGTTPPPAAAPAPLAPVPTGNEPDTPPPVAARFVGELEFAALRAGLAAAPANRVSGVWTLCFHPPAADVADGTRGRVSRSSPFSAKERGATLACPPLRVGQRQPRAGAARSLCGHAVGRPYLCPLTGWFDVLTGQLQVQVEGHGIEKVVATARAEPRPCAAGGEGGGLPPASFAGTYFHTATATSGPLTIHVQAEEPPPPYPPPLGGGLLPRQERKENKTREEDLLLASASSSNTHDGRQVAPEHEAKVFPPPSAAPCCVPVGEPSSVLRVSPLSPEDSENVDLLEGIVEGALRVPLSEARPAAEGGGSAAAAAKTAALRGWSFYWDGDDDDDDGGDGKLAAGTAASGAFLVFSHRVDAEHCAGELGRALAGGVWLKYVSEAAFAARRFPQLYRAARNNVGKRWIVQTSGCARHGDTTYALTLGADHRDSIFQDLSGHAHSNNVKSPATGIFDLLRQRLEVQVAWSGTRATSVLVLQPDTPLEGLRAPRGARLRGAFFNAYDGSSGALSAVLASEVPADQPLLVAVPDQDSDGARSNDCSDAQRPTSESVGSVLQDELPYLSSRGTREGVPAVGERQYQAFLHRCREAEAVEEMEIQRTVDDSSSEESDESSGRERLRCASPSDTDETDEETDEDVGSTDDEGTTSGGDTEQEAEAPEDADSHALSANPPVSIAGTAQGVTGQWRLSADHPKRQPSGRLSYTWLLDLSAEQRGAVDEPNQQYRTLGCAVLRSDTRATAALAKCKKSDGLRLHILVKLDPPADGNSVCHCEFVVPHRSDERGGPEGLSTLAGHMRSDQWTGCCRLDRVPSETSAAAAGGGGAAAAREEEDVEKQRFLAVAADFKGSWLVRIPGISGGGPNDEWTVRFDEGGGGGAARAAQAGPYLFLACSAAGRDPVKVTAALAYCQDDDAHPPEFPTISMNLLVKGAKHSLRSEFVVNARNKAVLAASAAFTPPHVAWLAGSAKMDGNIYPCTLERVTENGQRHGSSTLPTPQPALTAKPILNQTRPSGPSPAASHPNPDRGVPTATPQPGREKSAAGVPSQQPPAKQPDPPVANAAAGGSPGGRDAGGGVGGSPTGEPVGGVGGGSVGPSGADEKQRAAVDPQGDAEHAQGAVQTRAGVDAGAEPEAAAAAAAGGKQRSAVDLASAAVKPAPGPAPGAGRARAEAVVEAGAEAAAAGGKKQRSAFDPASRDAAKPAPGPPPSAGKARTEGVDTRPRIVEVRAETEAAAASAGGVGVKPAPGPPPGAGKARAEAVDTRPWIVEAGEEADAAVASQLDGPTARVDLHCMARVLQGRWQLRPPVVRGSATPTWKLSMFAEPPPGGGGGACGGEPAENPRFVVLGCRLEGAGPGHISAALTRGPLGSVRLHLLLKRAAAEFYMHRENIETRAVFEEYAAVALMGSAKVDGEGLIYGLVRCSDEGRVPGGPLWLGNSVAADVHESAGVSRHGTEGTWVLSMACLPQRDWVLRLDDMEPGDRQDCECYIVFADVTELKKGREIMATVSVERREGLVLRVAVPDQIAPISAEFTWGEDGFSLSSDGTLFIEGTASFGDFTMAALLERCEAANDAGDPISLDHELRLITEAAQEAANRSCDPKAAQQLQQQRRAVRGHRGGKRRCVVPAGARGGGGGGKGSKGDLLLFVVDRMQKLHESAALGLTDMAVEYGFFELDGQHGDDPGNDWDGSLCDLEELEECEEGDETWDEDLRPPRAEDAAPFALKVPKASWSNAVIATTDESVASYFVAQQSP